MPKSRTRKPRKPPARSSSRPARAWEDVPLLDPVAPVPTRATSGRAASSAAAVRDPDPLATLEALRGVVRDLDALARRRSALQQQRATLVDQARAEGASWATLRAITGTTRQALVSASARAGDAS